ncbi:cold shock domain-containing protein [Vibrio sp. ZSDE26]|uniref:Cold shock domain-containing protein n=1 Tax=Vibrio amylolyticus TaxID=2847292 RepID=A0A9X1XNH2_9VIBR|nr:cold shock domain-containing protein [Vibrio amylolyticus]MCK6265695.1 cold shock domain-containing protein [Vibrio amylolyticus]
MIIKGKISERYEDQHYGYITPDQSSLRIKFKFEDIKNDADILQINDKVVFKLSKDKAGQSHAVKIERQRHLHPMLIIAVWFLGSLTGCVWYFDYPIDVLNYYYFINSIVTLIVWLDSRAIKKNKPTTGEASYLFFAVLGGWIASLIFHYVWHLKQKSFFYQTLLFIVVFGHVTLFSWTLSHAGGFWLEQQLIALKPLLSDLNKML